jgi:hypothetical protein
MGELAVEVAKEKISFEATRGKGKREEMRSGKKKEENDGELEERCDRHCDGQRMQEPIQGEGWTVVKGS